MRFGRWAAAAVPAMLCAGQAQAATYVSYVVLGTGNLVYRNSYGDTTTVLGQTAVNFGLSFTIETDIAGPYYSFLGLYVTSSPSTYSAYAHHYQATASVTSNVFEFDQASSDGAGYQIISLLFGIPAGFGDTFPTAVGLLPPNGKLSYIDEDAIVTRQLTSSTVQQILVSPGDQYLGGYAALGPVPEPATWMTMIAGVGAIGAVSRRKRRAVAPT